MAAPKKYSNRERFNHSVDTAVSEAITRARHAIRPTPNRTDWINAAIMAALAEQKIKVKPVKT